MEHIAQTRLEVLEGVRALGMARSIQAYVRGNTVKFFEWLAASRVAAQLPVGPPVWICADCNPGNLRPATDVDGYYALTKSA